MNNIFSRTKLLIGEQKLNILQGKKVAIFGLGGVGGYAFELLVRAGINNFLLVDNDKFDETNLNRQVLATLQSIGKYKTEVAKLRALSINPCVNITLMNTFVLPSTLNEIDLSDVDFVIDAIDTISTKVALAKNCKIHSIKIISSMGTGNKLYASKFQIADISKTKYCPVCKIMRNLLKKENIFSLPVVYSEEKPTISIKELKDNKQTTSSISYVPAISGVLLAEYVIRTFLDENGNS